MRRKNEIDVSGMQTEFERSVELPVSEYIDTSETHEELASQFEVVDKISKTELELLAFMEEEVEVVIMDSESDYAEQVIHLCHNGRNQFMLRGVKQRIKRKFLDILARSKSEVVRTPPVMDSSGNETRSIKLASNLRYPFHVTNDPNPMGRFWLENTLAAPV